MTPERFAAEFGVARETIERLERYVALLEQWNRRINLVAAATLAEAWSRHIADSAQLLDLAPAAATTWIDLGTGAGLPGLVIAAIAAEKRPDLRVRLVERDLRKAVFLQEALRATGLAATVEAKRSEDLPAMPHDVVSARALAPLDRLCDLARRFTGPGTVLLFPKGARLDSELTAAARHWHIRAERVASRTDPAGTVLVIRELKQRS